MWALAAFAASVLVCKEGRTGDQAVEPRNPEIEAGVRHFYLMQEQGDVEGAVEHTAWALRSEDPLADGVREDVLSSMALGKPRLKGCSYDVRPKHGNIGRFVIVTCKTTRGVKQYAELLFGAAVYARIEKRTGKHFLIETVGVRERDE
jgi:hypothetical protein